MASETESDGVTGVETPVELVPMQPINQSRPDKVDFTITCKNDEGKTIKYGTEKSVLANCSGFFADMFDIGSSTQQDQEVEIMEFNSDVVASFLSIVHGKVDMNIWELDHASDVIDLGDKYRSDVVMIRGLSQFYRSFVDLALDKNSEGPKGTRFGKGALMKYVSLWKRGIEGDLCFPSDLDQTYFDAFSYIAAAWFDSCKLDIKTLSPIDLIEYDCDKYFTAADIAIFCKFLQKHKENLIDKSLDAFLDELKEENAQQQNQT